MHPPPRSSPVLAGHTVAMVTHCVTKTIRTCSPMIAQCFEPMIIRSSDKRVVRVTHQNLSAVTSKNEDITFLGNQMKGELRISSRDVSRALKSLPFRYLFEVFVKKFPSLLASLRIASYGSNDLNYTLRTNLTAVRRVLQQPLVKRKKEKKTHMEMSKLLLKGGKVQLNSKIQF